MGVAERFADLSTATVSDALDRLGIRGQVRGIGPVAGHRVCGPAYTVRYVPAVSGPGTVGDYIDDVAAGHVVLLDNGGMGDATVWGELLTRAAVERGVAGTVIHGVCRDVSEATTGPEYPVFARGRYMRTGKGRVRVAGVNQAVSLGTAAVEPGDVLFGDGDGLVVIPADRLDDTLARAREIDEAERWVRGRLAEGARLDEARRDVGYHGLQEPR